LIETDIQSWQWEHEQFGSNCLWQSNIGKWREQHSYTVKVYEVGSIPAMFSLPFTYVIENAHGNQESAIRL
jgi:hypothetical protein